MDARSLSSFIVAFGLITLCGCPGLGMPNGAGHDRVKDSGLPEDAAPDAAAERSPEQVLDAGSMRNEADVGQDDTERSDDDSDRHDNPAGDEANAGAPSVGDEPSGDPAAPEPAPGSTCEHAIALAAGTSHHVLENVGEIGTARYFSYTLLPRQALQVGVTASQTSSFMLYGFHGDCTHDSYPVGADISYLLEPESSEGASFLNHGPTPITLLLSFSFYGSSPVELGFELLVSDACSGDRCDSTCGDGLVTGSEQCDDGNLAAGDGCSASCVREFGFGCSGEPSLCAAALASDLCEIAEPLVDGEATLSGFPYEAECGAAPCQSSSRWWVIDAPDSGNVQVLWVGLDSEDSLAGEVRLWPYTTATCNGLITEPFARFRFGGPTGRLRASHGVSLFVATGTRVAVEVIDLSHNPSSAHFTLHHKLSAPGCGDGWLDPGFHVNNCTWSNEHCDQAPEPCDDANTVSGDGCSETCSVEPGWDCSSGPCVQANCGDGVVYPSEECDDGGHVDGDGCSADCHYEPGYLCPPNPEPCAPYQPGDACGNAEPLASGDYSWSGYLADNHCTLFTPLPIGRAPACHGIDRWFEVMVPAGYTLDVRASTSTHDGHLELIDIEHGCRGSATSGAYLENADFWVGWPADAAHFNTTAAPRRIAVALSLATGDAATGSFSLSYTLAPSGCGDGYRDLSGEVGPVEACDDGNTTDSDGCSASCTLE